MPMFDRQPTMFKHPLTGRPMIFNDDGSVSTEEITTVTVPMLNGGLPTNIPTIWDGKRLSVEEAAARAVLESRLKGTPFPSFNTIDEAVSWAKTRTNMLGRAMEQRK